MIKRFVFTAIVAYSVSFSALAKDIFITEWQVNSSNTAYVFSSNKKVGAMYVEYEGVKTVLFKKLEKCSGKKTFETIGTVNNQPINFVAMCIYMHMNYMAKSEKGKTFIFNEFKTKSDVIFNKNTFTSNQFLESIKKHKDNKKQAF